MKMKVYNNILFEACICLSLFACSKENAEADKLDNPGITTESTKASTTAGSNLFIDFEGASIASSNFYLTNNGVTYPFITKGTYVNPVLTTLEHFKGNSSIVYQMPQTTISGSVTNDKSQHRIFGGSDVVAMGFNDKRYFGFAVKLDDLTEQPVLPCQLFQIWQGTPMSPPVDLSIAPGGSGNTFVIKLFIRNNSTTANPSAATTIYTGSIQKGVWNTFVLMSIMRNTQDTQDGEIKLWVNGGEVVRWFGRVGYANGIVYAGNPYTPNAKFDAFFGPYRACQNANIKMYYDQVKYATTYSAADPDQ